MRFDIAGFTHRGTVRALNEDRILVQGDVLAEGHAVLERQLRCFCAVADGIGGSPAGDEAAEFVLRVLSTRLAGALAVESEHFREMCDQINYDLVARGRATVGWQGMGTTLIAAYADESGQLVLFNAGDAEAWLLRASMFFQVNRVQVLETTEFNSPITSYFGGDGSALDLDFSSTVRSLQGRDVLLLCSDGLFKAVASKQVKHVLGNGTSLSDRIQFLQTIVLGADAPDNVSAIIIDVIV